MDAENQRRLEKILGIPELRWLVARLRRRIELGGAPAGRISVTDISAPELEALNRILGRRLAAGARSFAADELERVLAAAGLASSLREAVEALAGPCLERGAARRSLEQRWAAIFSRARESREAGMPALSVWLREIEESGLLRRLSGGNPAQGEDLIQQALKIAAALPSPGVSLAELAATATGDSHALDPGAPLATLVLKAVCALTGSGSRPRDAESRRTLWESVGVFTDALSASVLVMNLPAAPSSLCGATLLAHALEGEPCRLTLRELIRHPPRFGDDYRDRAVFVCENPMVLAAACDRLGASSAPLVCIEGRPRTPASRLLRALSEAGARLRYHGDFDWEGIRIANFVLRSFGATPWRMETRDYEAACRAGLALDGEAASADWDPSLGPRMLERGMAVHEEAVLDALCEDLSAKER